MIMSVGASVLGYLVIAATIIVVVLVIWFAIWVVRTLRRILRAVEGASVNGDGS
jgi:hypothetical protein